MGESYHSSDRFGPQATGEVAFETGRWKMLSRALKQVWKSLKHFEQGLFCSNNSINISFGVK